MSPFQLVVQSHIVRHKRPHKRPHKQMLSQICWSCIRLIELWYRTDVDEANSKHGHHHEANDKCAPFSWQASHDQATNVENPYWYYSQELQIRKTKTTPSVLHLLMTLLTVQNRAQVHRKPTGDLVPFSPRRILPRFFNPRIGSKPLRFSI
jgi:hypothetical protein